MIEFALLVPVLLMILIAIFEFGLIFNSYLTLQNASRDAVRLLSLGVTDTEATTVVQNQAVGVDLSQLTITITPTESSRSSGDSVTITLSYDHSVITPLMAVFIGNTLTLEVQSVMRVE
jgi:Flp pilus assembly protein TadG